MNIKRSIAVASLGAVAFGGSILGVGVMSGAASATGTTTPITATPPSAPTLTPAPESPSGTQSSDLGVDVAGSISDGVQSGSQVNLDQGGTSDAVLGSALDVQSGSQVNLDQSSGGVDAAGATSSDALGTN